nr:hypothetical protein [Desulforhabdus sp. TSK]
MKYGAVLGEELISEPGFQGLSCVIGLVEQLGELVIAPRFAVSGSKQV